MDGDEQQIRSAPERGKREGQSRGGAAVRPKKRREECVVVEERRC